GARLPLGGEEEEVAQGLAEGKGRHLEGREVRPQGQSGRAPPVHFFSDGHEQVWRGRGGLRGAGGGPGEVARPLGRAALRATTCPRPATGGPFCTAPTCRPPSRSASARPASCATRTWS